MLLPIELFRALSRAQADPQSRHQPNGGSMILSTSAAHIVNDLLEGELAATETYQQALAQVGDEPGAEELRRIHVEHREAANRLRQFVRELGGEPAQSSQT